MKMPKGLCVKGMSKKAAAAGFTLIELLVVISIIALLLSILMPALAAVRQASQAVVCSTNLKTLGMSWSIYTTEFNDRLPMWGSWEWTGESVGYGNSWTTIMKPYLSQRPRDVAVYSKNGGNNGNMSAGDYFEIGGVLRCPSMPKNPQGNPYNVVKANTFEASRFPHYAINAMWAGGKGGKDWGGVIASVPKFRKMTQLKKTASRIVFADCAFYVPSQPAYNRKDMGWYYFEAVANELWNPLIGGFRHRAKNNALFGDGHVKDNTKEQIFLRDGSSLYTGPLSIID